MKSIVYDEPKREMQRIFKSLLFIREVKNKKQGASVPQMCNHKSMDKVLWKQTGKRKNAVCPSQSN